MTRTFLGRARADRVGTPMCHDHWQNGIGLGTDVLTADGALPVEYLTPGDKVVTFDQGLVRLARIEIRLVPASAALRLRPSVIDPDGAGRDLVVSERQQILLRDWRARAIWGRPTALVEARQLIDGASVARLRETGPVRLFDLVFDDSQHIVLAAGGRYRFASARMPATAES